MLGVRSRMPSSFCRLGVRWHLHVVEVYGWYGCSSEAVWKVGEDVRVLRERSRSVFNIALCAAHRASGLTRRSTNSKRDSNGFYKEKKGLRKGI